MKDAQISKRLLSNSKEFQGQRKQKNAGCHRKGRMALGQSCMDGGMVPSSLFEKIRAKSKVGQSG
eukprot:4113548-Karenia_brevis.AAC.1